MAKKKTQESIQPTEKQNNADNYASLAQGMKQLSSEYGNLPIDSVFSAFMGAGGGKIWGTAFRGMPEIQNTRVKRINTTPADFSKDEISDMLENPEQNEKNLRAVSASLSTTTKTYDLIIQTYANIMSYFWYVYPTNIPDGMSKEAIRREYALAYKIAKAIGPEIEGHKATGLAMKYGKVFYIPRVSVDKTHNKVNFAFLQQLPEDYCKIVGFNNAYGRYTVAFNLLYFLQPGNTWEQFGNLFRPYMDAFYQVVETDKKYAYCSENATINIDKFKELEIGKTAGNPQWQMVGNAWYYWVTLPADAVMTFEIDDRSPYVIPPQSGLMVSMTQIPNFENAQMEIVLSPLTAVMTGELETFDPKGSTNADPIRVSPGVRALFESYWYQMLNANNTAGVGIYMAPAKNLKLQTLSDTVANTDITSTALSDQIMKAGLPALIPTTDDPKVGVAELSAMLHANVARPIYWGFERLMEHIFESLNFKCSFGFKMFGTVFDKEKDLKNAMNGMTLGILPETLKYDAINGHSILDDIAISDFVSGTGLLDKRIPLVTSYSAKQGESGLPPKAKESLNPGGRTPEDGSENSQKTQKTQIV